MIPSLGGRDLHLVPVMPRIICTQGLLDTEFGEMADPFHGIHYGLAFQSQLGRIGKVLELAAAALGIDGAGRFHPVRRGYQQLLQPGLTVAFFQQGHLGLDPFSRQSTGDEEGKAADFAHPFPGTAQPGNGQFDILFELEWYLILFHNTVIIPLSQDGRNVSWGKVPKRQGKEEKDRKSLILGDNQMN